MELADAAKALWEAPFAVLAHDKFKSDKPAFTYANQVRHRGNALGGLQYGRSRHAAQRSSCPALGGACKIV